jgi:hypothetical protein
MGLSVFFAIPLQTAHCQTLLPAVAPHATTLPKAPVVFSDRQALGPPAFVPMTGSDRVQDFLRVNFESRGAFFQTFFTGLGDTTSNIPKWDSGALGFSEHMGSEFARFTIGGAIHSSVAATLHQDTRYFRCTCQGGLHRTIHAMSRTLVTYDDHGRLRPDISGLAGIYSGPMIMTSWYPSNYTPLGYGVRQGNIAAGITTAIYVIREFSPEITRALHHTGGSRLRQTP